MSNISTEYWEDGIPDPDEVGVDTYLSYMENLHAFMPGPRDPKWGTRRCIAKSYRRDGTEYICNGSSHDSMHLPTEGCCYCKHGVYLHTSYDIPCGRCEMGDYEE